MVEELAGSDLDELLTILDILCVFFPNRDNSGVLTSGVLGAFLLRDPVLTLLGLFNELNTPFSTQIAHTIMTSYHKHLIRQYMLEVTKYLH